MSKLAVLLVALAANATAAAQVTPKDLLTNLALRDEFRNRTATNASLFAERVAAPAVEYQLTTGVGYSDPGGGVKTTSLPNELSIKFNSSATIVLLDIDAYDWVRTRSDNVSGVGDPTFWIVQRLWPSSPDGPDSISIAGGVTVPSGSDVSSFSASQSVKLLWGHKFKDEFKDDKIKLTVRLDHSNESFPNVSSYITSGKFYYEHDFSPVVDVFASIRYSYQSGVGGVTTAGLGMDFPISNQSVGPFKAVGGTLQGSCALSSGRHCGRIELDFVLPFL